MRKVVKLGGKIMLSILALVLLVIIVLMIIICAKSSGKPTQFVDETGKILEGSISEKIYVDINGVRQGMFIKGKDKTNPVLLFLHGGPAMSENWMNQKHSSKIEDEFVVCWWEQRGAGISYSKDIPVETLTSEQLVLDTIEVSKYLKDRFSQEKIYLLGHSWGSTLGIQAASKAPELYHAYIGMGQISDLNAMEQMTYDYCLEYYKKSGNKKMIDKMLKNPYDTENPTADGWAAIHDSVTGNAGVATTREMKSEITGIFFPSFFAEEYTVIEKINWWKGFFSDYARDMKQKLYYTDYSEDFNKFEIPIYFLSGKYDYAVANPLSKEYLNKLNAPTKGFYAFENSAHSPIFEESELFMKVLCEDVLNGTTNLADSLH